MHVQKPAAVEQLRPDLVALSNMAIAFLPATFRLHNVSEATREVVNGVRYALVANAIDATGAECVCELIVLERPWILVGEFDKHRELLHSNCTTEDEDANGVDASIVEGNRIANDANNFNFNPVFVNQGQMDSEFLRNLEAQIVPPQKPRATKKPTVVATKPPRTFDTTALDEALRLIEADILPFERQPHADSEHQQQQPIGVDVVDCPHAMNRVAQALPTLPTEQLQQQIDDMLKAIRITEAATEAPNVQLDTVTEQLSDTQKGWLDAFFGVDTVDTQPETTPTATFTTTIESETTTPDNTTPAMKSIDALSPLADVATTTGAPAYTEDTTPPTATTDVDTQTLATASAVVVDSPSESTSMAADALDIARDVVAEHSEVLLWGYNWFRADETSSNTAHAHRRPSRNVLYYPHIVWHN